MSAWAQAPAGRRQSVGIVRLIKAVLLGTLAGLTPVTSLVSLGWVSRQMRSQALVAAGLEGTATGWVLGRPGGGLLTRLLGGLAANIREGVKMAFSLMIAAFPFSLVWLLSWWAGWENSFSKGYEQAFVGPILGLAGVVIFSVVLIWHPMALAHQAVEGRSLAFFEWRRVRSAVRHAGFGYLLVALATVVLALPLFAARGLVVFASDIIPAFDNMSADAAAALSGQIALAKAGYAFVALMILRGWLAKVYARAVARALAGPDAGLWANSPLAEGSIGGRRSWKLTHWFRAALLAIVWFGLAAQIYVGQFLNYDWYIWLTHPFWMLPWPG